MSQIVKQTIRVRSGNGRRTDAPTVLPAESSLAKIRLLMARSVSAGAFASVAEYGNMDASKSPRYAFIFMPNPFAPVMEHRYFALARFSAATPEVVRNPSFEIQ